MVADHAFRGNRITSVERRHQKRLGSDHVRSSKASSSPCRHGRSAARADTLGSVPGSGVSDGGVSVPDVRGPSRESLW
ncbi:hypothetical protein GBO22_16245 [Mycobacterium avium subsp. hominissuis]|nr:hypothetical protein [Mycobacterium avium subsp. hominissuis]